MEGVQRSYVGELANSIGFDSDVVLLELLFDLIDACGDVLGLKGECKQQTPDQIRWSDIWSEMAALVTSAKWKNQAHLLKI